MCSSIAKALRTLIQIFHSLLLNSLLFCRSTHRRYLQSTSRTWSKLTRNKSRLITCPYKIIMRTHLLGRIQCQAWVQLQASHQVLTSQVSNLSWRAHRWRRRWIMEWCHSVPISNRILIEMSKKAKMKLKWAIMKHF
jgi:hypothetical protein